MTFKLTIDRNSFDKNLRNVISDYQDAGSKVVPVIKGNGYGFGRQNLAAEVSKINLPRIAIGSVYELDQALSNFGGEIVVLEPFNPNDNSTIPLWEHATKNNAHRIIAIIAGPYFEQASRSGIKQAYLEGKTSMHRFGVLPKDILSLVKSDRHNIEVVGLSLHLPIAQPQNVQIPQLETSAKVNNRKTSNRVLEIVSWMINFAPMTAELVSPINLSLSHVSAKDVSQILEISRERGLNIQIESRIGTALWLGNQKALKATGTVLEIHELVGDHEHIGYRQIDAHGNARLLVVSGGTAHGVALAAPTNRDTLRAKGIALAEGLSQALGKVRSPFKLGKQNLAFAEPPHMHVSLLWCEDRNVKVGDQLECTVRNTTASFDEIIWN